VSHYSGSVPATPRATTWRDQAGCIGKDAELFHAGERNRNAIEQARAICDRCPVRTACLLAAYQEEDEWGLRAGLTPRQRNAHLRKAEGNIARAVADALEDTALILRNIYQHHAKPADGGHVLWTDQRHFINVRNRPYTVHRLAWIALYGVEPVGHVQRACKVEGCVARACLTDRWMRDRAAASRKKAAA
jgi:WhiB family redox-sensing transcriptional regulator